MRTLDFKGIAAKTGVLKEQVNISESFSLFDASYSAFNPLNTELIPICQ